MTTQIAIQALTAAALTGLLLTSGLRLEVRQVLAALQQKHLMIRTLVVNFAVVPALVLGVILLADLPREIAIGMLLLAAAPFAPVVPIFTKMARGDLALAAGLTAVFPLLSAFLTPLICMACLKAVPGAGELNFHFLRLLLVLFATITLPLAAGLALRHYRPDLATKLLRPVEVISEAIGAVSLAFVTIVEFGAITGIGGRPLLVMAGLCEATMLLGYVIGGPAASSRQVIAFGTSNRNIALALLVAAGSFAGTPIMAAVVANGLLLILLGLAHVAWWRWRPAPGA
jgi:BASS family bile acid:Na+ symporter